MFTKSFLATIILVIWTIASYSQDFNRNRIDVKSYEIVLDIRDFKTETIAGYTTIQFTTEAGLDSLTLDFAGLTTDSVKLSPKERVEFKQQGEQLFIFSKFEKRDSVTVYYHGKPKADAAWGGFFFTDSVAFNMGVGMASYPHAYGRVWFPCNDSFTDKATFRFDITVPPTMLAVCSGVLDRIYLPDNKSYRRFVWYLDRPVPTYLANVSVGEYERVEQMYQGIKRKIPIDLYFRSEYKKNIEKSFLNLKQCLSGFETHYGEYVWSRVGYVGVPFDSGAMEHCCNISYPEYAADGAKTNETLMAHELSHHWFGNLVTCKTSQDMWLNEGWASFSEALFTETVYGKEAYKKYVRDNHLKVLTMTHQYDRGYRAVYGVPPEFTYGSTVYDKGADVAHTLRGYMGDSIFFSAITSYMHDFAYKSADTYEFRDYLSEKSGIDLTDFFDMWVFTPGFPHFSANITEILKDGDGYKVKIQINQRLKARTLLGKSIKADITFVNNSLQKQTIEIQFSGEKSEHVLDVPFKPTAVIFDPEEKISDAKVDCVKEIDKKGIQVFDYTGFKTNVRKLKGKIYIQAALNFIAPENTDSTIYTILPEKYWTIIGAGGKFEASGSFFVSSTEFNTTESVDILKLFYRENSEQTWKPCDFKLEKKNAYEGYFVVEKLKFGEFAVGWVNVRE